LGGRAAHFLLAASLLIASPGRSATSALAGKTIGSITIVQYNVFEREAFHDPKLLYWAANRFHHRTQERVIRAELLFSEGDPCNPALLAETERNIRSLPFIRRAEVSSTVNKGGTVDVVVRTYDAWTLEVLASVSRAGGQNNIKAGLGENNIAGLGISLGGSYSGSGGSGSTAFKLKDSILYGRKVEYSVAYLSAPGSRDYALGVNRPFYTSIIPHAFGANAAYSDHVVPDFSGDALLGTMRKQTTDVGGSYGVAFATSTQRVRRLTFGLTRHIAEFAPAPGVAAPSGLPHAEHLNFLSLAGEWQIYDYIKEQQIQKFSHDEDINLGFGVLPVVAWSPPVPGKSNGTTALPGVILSKGYHWEAGRLLLMNGGYSSTYVDGGGSSKIGLLNLNYFSHGLPRETIALHAGIQHAFQLDPAAPLTLGEDSGLRGYRAGQFTGDKRLLLNVEDRIFIKNEIYTLIDLGAVVFFDSGYVWPKGTAVRLSDLKSGVGVGLRLAPSRSGNNQPVRIDLAYALNDGPTRSHLSLSILAGQAF
jgi:hemolysin activation/secretion protein